MEPISSEYDIYGPNGGDEWFQTEGIDKRGTTTFINFFCKDESEVPALAHGLGIAKSVTFHKASVYLGKKKDYNTEVG